MTEEQVFGESSGRQFIINTSVGNLDAVEAELKQTFGDKLITNDVKVEHVLRIEPPPSRPGKPAAEGATAGSSSSARQTR